jgi:MoxR-like ATPase
MVNIAQAKERILSKWDWNNPTDNYPIILWSAPGLGKTSLVYELIAERMIHELDKEFAELIFEMKGKDKNYDSSKEYIEAKIELDRKKKILNFIYVGKEFLDLIAPHCLVLRLAERPIEQLQGVIVPSLSENYAKFVMPENLERCKKSSYGICFLDELDKCSDTKFGAATHLLENRVIGDFALGEGWYVIGACNREEDSILSNPVPPELRNRCAHLEIEPDLDTWIKWAVDHDVRKDIILFHKFNNGEWLVKYDLEQTYAYPTPRSWVMASRVIDKLEKKLGIDKNNTEQVEYFNNIVRNELQDFVGKQAQTEFFMYRELYLKYDVMKILEGEERIPTKDSMSGERLISEQCIAAFAMSDRIDSDMFVVEKACEANKHKAKFNNKYVKNIVRFMGDLVPEVRTIYLRQIHATRLINIIMDSGMAEQEIDELIRFIAAG